MAVDVQALGVDWIVASGHKMCGPTGIGFLWARPEHLKLVHSPAPPEMFRAGDLSLEPLAETAQLIPQKVLTLI